MARRKVQFDDNPIKTVETEEVTDERLLRELESLRDQLKNDILAEAQNNLNSYLEMKDLRNQLVQRMIEPLKLRRMIGRKLRQFKPRVLNAYGRILSSNLTQLKLLAKEQHAESKLDYSMFRAGQVPSYELFLANFIDHRTKYHLHRAKAKKLASDLGLLQDMFEFCRKYPH